MKRVSLFAASALAGVLLGGCGGGGGGPTATPDMAMLPACEGGEERAVVLTELVMQRQNPKGVSLGFNLDGRVGMKGDPATCGHASLMGPNGETGIDNQLSEVLPVLDAQTNGAVDGLLQDAINNGMLLMGLRMLHVSGTTDECVDVEFRRLTGTTIVGTDKRLEANQTFDTSKVDPISKVRAKLKDNVLEAGPFEMVLPVRILGVSFNMRIHDARVRVTFKEDGTATGLLGGGVEVEQLISESMTFDIPSALKNTVAQLLVNIADLERDDAKNECRQFSSAIAFAAKPVFINP